MIAIDIKVYIKLCTIEICITPEIAHSPSISLCFKAKFYIKYFYVKYVVYLFKTSRETDDLLKARKELTVVDLFDLNGLKSVYYST